MPHNRASLVLKPNDDYADVALSVVRRAVVQAGLESEETHVPCAGLQGGITGETNLNPEIERAATEMLRMLKSLQIIRTVTHARMAAHLL